MYCTWAESEKCQIVWEALSCLAHRGMRRSVPTLSRQHWYEQRPMITLDELKLRVGTEYWESARRQAWRLSPATGTWEQCERSTAERKDALEYVRDLLDKSTGEGASDKCACCYLR